jgi:transposase
MFAFGQYGRRLVDTATMYKNRTILRGSDAYTSKQCGARGCINDRLGCTLARTSASTTLVCAKCSNVSHRDIHAARNMLLQLTP